MITERYSYQRDWNEIYGNPAEKPWIRKDVSPYLAGVFGDDDFFQKHQNNRIIDIGCGDGTFCRYLAKRGYRYVKGVDASDRIIEACRENSPSQIEFEQADIVTDSPGEQYDVVICWLVLHHIRQEDVGKFIGNLFKNCRTGGTLFLSFLLPEGRTRSKAGSLFSTKHELTLYPRKDVVRLFSDHFNILNCHTEQLDKSSVENPFRYQVIRMEKTTRLALEESINTFKNRFILPESGAYDEECSIEDQTKALIKMLDEFSWVTKRGGLSETDFSTLYIRLFRNVSRFLCKRILSEGMSKDNKDPKEDVVILKMDIRAAQTIYTATKYAVEEEKHETKPRPHSRFGANKKRSVSSRAYDLFLFYRKYLQSRNGLGYTLHQHFADNSDLCYICFSLDGNGDLVPACQEPEGIPFTDDKDYRAFLKSIFTNNVDPQNQYARWLTKALQSGGNVPEPYYKSFSCFNLGILGFESWGTLMMESRKDVGNIIKLFYEGLNETVLMQDIKNIIFILKKIDYDYAVFESQRQLKAQAIKAAIAQVMARNMSHNIGSHVMSGLVDDNVYGKLKDIKLKPDTRKGFRHGYLSFAGDNQDEIVFDERNLEAGKNLQLAYFNRYLKSRMDYLSEISFGVSDLVSMKMLYSDVMKELDRVRVLLDRISGVSEFDYEFKLMRGDRDLKDEDIGVAFPQDVLGCHAFYNILENIIRNTAKHSGAAKDKVTFTIKVTDSGGAEDIEGADELYCVEIDDGISKDDIKEVVKAQNEWFNTPILDEFNNLRSRALGLLEMKASAAFLRQIDLVDIASDAYRVDEETDYHESAGVNRLNIIRAFKAPGKALGYRFYIQKPKEFLFVGDFWPSNSSMLLDYGIQFTSTKDFIRDLESGKALAHPFLIFDSTAQNIFSGFLEKNPDVKTLVTLRRISVNEHEKENICSLLNVLIDNSRNAKAVTHRLRSRVWELYLIESGYNGPGYQIHSAMRDTLDMDTAILLHHAVGYDKAESEMNTKGVKVWLESVPSRIVEKLPYFSEIVDPGEPGELGEKLTDYIDAIRSSGKQPGYPDIVAEIFEAYWNKIIVIDERVQRFAEETSETDVNSKVSIKCDRLFLSTGVMIPSRSMIPLDPNSFSEKIGGKTIREKLEEYIESECRDAFLLIHYGILERAFKEKDKGAEERTIAEYLEKWACAAKRVVVTSGRGAHSLKLPDAVSFVNLSSMLYACCENRNKYLINNLLNQSRRKRK